MLGVDGSADSDKDIAGAGMYEQWADCIVGQEPVPRSDRRQMIRKERKQLRSDIILQLCDSSAKTELVARLAKTPLRDGAFNSRVETSDYSFLQGTT